MKKLLLTFSFCLFLLNAFCQIANQPSDLSVCDDDNDGFSLFDLTQLDAEVIGSQNPADFILTYHETQSEADGGFNAIASPYANIAYNSQTIRCIQGLNATNVANWLWYNLIFSFQKT